MASETNSAPVVKGLSGKTSIRFANQPIVCSHRAGVASGVPSLGDATSTACPRRNRSAIAPCNVPVLDEAAQHEPAARMRDRVERILAGRERLEELLRILVRRAAHRKVIERVDPVAVERPHAIEEVGAGKRPERAGGVGERPVDQEQRALAGLGHAGVSRRPGDCPPAGVTWNHPS